MNSTRKWFKFFTVEQWQAIDIDYHVDRKADHKVLLVFAVSISVILIQNQFTNPGFLMKFFFLRDFILARASADFYPPLYWALSTSLDYFLLPAIVIWFVYREPLANFGLRLEKDKRILLLYLVLFLAVIIPVWFASSAVHFHQIYPVYRSAGDSLPGYLIWEFTYALQFIMIEFFYRGFMIFALARYFGYHAIFIMAIPYTMVHFSKPLPEAIGSAFTGLALGTLALRTRSIFGGVIIHAAVAISMDTFILIRQGKLQKLLGS